MRGLGNRSLVAQAARQSLTRDPKFIGQLRRRNPLLTAFGEWPRRLAVLPRPAVLPRVLPLRLRVFVKCFQRCKILVLRLDKRMAWISLAQR